MCSESKALNRLPRTGVQIHARHFFGVSVLLPYDIDAQSDGVGSVAAGFVEPGELLVRQFEADLLVEVP